ncbi:TPA: acyltransferase family protein [Citrobacter braakii]|uniref:acyltransferase family protein n=1 Tax=Citrobacter TaxID=544 RepID=UPI000BAE63B6|nr:MULTISPECIES: acyltransferase [Citrobacter]MEB0939153.1 acyltransferase [Citrobacter braakii]MEB0944364.1 acyltransferase [Citrobacter braakii]MEB0969171.1 acyltransferase [Citrobacter braakii]MEB0993569.1 acyltransferase [Citrobacter braakii]MEB1009086.1 acyltransferase [Citrobacter braakii]
MFYKQLHGLRGLASLMVFFAHITAGYNLHVNNIWGSYNEPGTIQYSITNIGTYGVEVFFFLSGFVIYKSSKSELEHVFFVRRFFRVYPVFFIFTCLFMALNYFTNTKPELNNFSVIFLNLTFLNLFFDTPALTPNAWSITYEVIYYFCTFYITSNVLKNSKLNFKKIIAISIGIWMLYNHPITIYYILGVVVSIYIEKIIKWVNKINRLLTNVIFMIFLAMLVYYISDGAQIEWSGSSHFIINGLLQPMLLTIVICLTFAKSLVFNRFLESRVMMYCGTISYTLYLLHPYIYKIFQTVAIKLSSIGIIPAVLFYVFIALCLAVTLAISGLINKYYEVPIYDRFAKKKLYR